jgi:hypothetical protein
MGATNLLAQNLSRRSIYAAAVMIGVMVLGVWLISGYASRGLWYAEYGAVRRLFAWWCGVAAGSFMVIRGLLEPRQTRRPLGIVASTIFMVICLCAVAVTWLVTRPTIEGAEAALLERDLEHARTELIAAEDRGADPSEVARVRRLLEADASERASRAAPAKTADDRRLDQIGNGSLRVDTTLVLRREWEDANKQALGRKRVLERARAIADDAWKRSDGPLLDRIAADTAGLDQAFTTLCEHRAALANAQSCLDHQRHECAQTSLQRFDEVDLDELDPELQERLHSLRDELSPTATNTSSG